MNVKEAEKNWHEKTKALNNSLIGFFEYVQKIGQIVEEYEREKEGKT